MFLPLLNKKRSHTELYEEYSPSLAVTERSHALQCGIICLHFFLHLSGRYHKSDSAILQPPKKNTRRSGFFFFLTRHKITVDDNKHRRTSKNSWSKRRLWLGAIPNRRDSNQTCVNMRDPITRGQFWHIEDTSTTFCATCGHRLLTSVKDNVSWATKGGSPYRVAPRQHAIHMSICTLCFCDD